MHFLKGRDGGWRWQEDEGIHGENKVSTQDQVVAKLRFYEHLEKKVV